MLDEKKNDLSPPTYGKPSISWNAKNPTTSDLPASKSLAQKYNAQVTGPRSMTTFKSVVPTHYYPPSRYHMNFLQWPKSDLPKGISSVTERRLLAARADILHQRTQTGLSAAQSLPKITESIALQLQQNQRKKAPWARATASEPHQRAGLTNINYRQSTKLPHNTGPPRSSTASDFAWYRNSRVSDIWK